MRKTYLAHMPVPGHPFTYEDIFAPGVLSLGSADVVM